jgi:curved DNA-binding protein CbpA
MAPSQHQQQQQDRSVRKDAANSELSLYEILQVPSTASVAIIKEAYQAAARQHHPDKRRCDDKDNDLAVFLRVQTAWECLRDPETRKQYDQNLLIRNAAKNHQRRNAVPVYAHECREVEHNDGDDGYYELIYQCRCGSDLCTSQLPGLDGSTDDESAGSSCLVQCPGCSLVYDISPLFDEHEERT